MAIGLEVETSAGRAAAIAFGTSVVTMFGASALYHTVDWPEARRIHYRHLRLMNLNFMESNPGPVKASLALMGLCAESFRLPMCPPTEATKDALRKELRELGLVS